MTTASPITIRIEACVRATCLISTAALSVAWPALSYAQCPATSIDPASFTRAAEDGPTAVYFRTEPRYIPLGEFFSLEVSVCHEAKQWLGSLAVDATMPAHGHGMNYKPQFTRKEDVFIVDGFLFHMPGQWRLDFILQGDAGSHHIYSFIDVR